MQADALGRALHEGTQFGLLSGCRCHCSELMGGRLPAHLSNEPASCGGTLEAIAASCVSSLEASDSSPAVQGRDLLT